MIVVIADDITGAAEIAGVCLRYGLRVVFTLEVMAFSNTDVVVLATDMRSMPLQDAVQEMVNISTALKQAGVQNIFTKTDSVLRGHVLAALKVALNIFEKPNALLVPANPEKGRTIANGHYYINEMPLNNTGFAEDPDFPIRFSGVEEILGASALALHTGEVERLEEGVTIPDTVLKEDLEKHGQWAGPDVLLAGSAAFFEVYLKKVYGIAEFLPGNEALTLAGKTLIVCGSTHEESRTFVREAKKRLLPVSEMPQSLVQKEVDKAHLEEWVNEVTSLLKQANKVVVAVNQRTASFEGSAKIIKETVAKALKKILARNTIQELLIEGGATAFAIVRESGFESFIPVNELGNGVVRMKILRRWGTFLTIKPGSYRWPEGLLQL